MWVIILIISVVFVSIAFIINKNNAKYLLAGYNAMSDEQRKSFDIDGYLKAFRKIFVFTGLSIIIGYVYLYFSSSEEYGFILIFIIPFVLLPLLLYISKKYKNDSCFGNGSKTLFYWILGLIIVGLPALILTMVLFSGLSKTNFNVLNDRFVIDGSYGREILYSDIKVVDLVNKLPDITRKTNGIDLGQNLKGYYLSKEEGKVYLNVKLRNFPFIKIVTLTETIYLSNADSNIESVYNKLKMNIE